jgi:hypothetical protein
MFDEELILFGSILVNTEIAHSAGDILSGSCNASESNAPDLRIVAGAPRGRERWAERKQAGSRPKWEHFYFAVPIGDYCGQVMAQPFVLGEPLVNRPLEVCESR